MKMIVHMDRNGGIGKNGAVLADIPTDMKYFRSTTLGHAVIMGRKTLESFPGGRPLTKRRNIVLSTTLTAGDGYEVCRNAEELLQLLSAEEKAEAFVIGGGEIYRLLLPYVQEAYITEIDAELEADTAIPVFSESREWQCVSRSEPVRENGLTYTFAIYRRSEA